MTAQVPPAAKAFTQHTLIRNMSCNDDTVALAIWHGTSALVFDANSKTFQTVPLPDGEVAVSSAVADNGMVAFGLQNAGTAGPHEVLLYQPDTGKSKEVAVQSSVPIQAVPGGGSGPLFATDNGAQTISVGADVADVTVAAPGTVSPGAGLDPYRPSMALLPDGRTVAPSPKGILVAGSTGKDPQLIHLGTRPCGFSITPSQAGLATDASTTTQNPDAQCPIGTQSVAVDASGTIWYSGYLGDGSTVPVRWVAAPPA